jgi:hypothetical protein
MTLLLESRNRAFGCRLPKTSCATCSPRAGASLNPCPEPPPTNHTFAASGWWSKTKFLSGVSSYWQTRASRRGDVREVGHAEAETQLFAHGMNERRGRRISVATTIRCSRSYSTGLGEPLTE